MPLPDIDFETIFLGAWVAKFQSTAGLNGDAGGITVTLVEDDTHTFTPLQEGTPTSFTCGDFRFDGIYQFVNYNSSVGGKDITVFLSNVSELLNGVQVILSDYNGQIYGTPNLINAYGYLENALGFGGSLVNDAGMPWYVPVEELSVSASGDLTLTGVSHIGLRPALENLINFNANYNYGSGIVQANHKYLLDLEDLHTTLNVPTYYRVGGPNQSLLEIIGGIYRDSGHDYIPILTVSGSGPHIISFKSISRVDQVPVGQIAQFIAETPNVISYQTGCEFRNEPTNVFMVGAQQETIYPVEYNGTNIYPYWGYDWDGHVIMGSGTGDGYRVDLNASPIIDIMSYLGGDPVRYNVSPTELRMALADYDSWAFFICKNKYSTVAAPLGIVSTAAYQNLPISPIMSDFIADDPFTVAMANSGVASNLINKSQRLYEFVRNYAESYYGRQFLVLLPNIFKIQLEPNSNNAQYSAVPTDAAYFGEGQSPLGLNFINEIVFLNDQNKFHAFARYDGIGTSDITSISQEGSVMQNDGVSITDLYTSCDISERIHQLQDGRFCAVATFSSPVREKPDSYLGDIEMVASVFGCTVADLVNAIDITSDSFPVKCVPRFRAIDAIAVPMRSNTSVYGPYRILGAQGKTHFIKDDQLAPWTYGAYDVMDDAALAQIQGFATNLQVIDTGTVTVPGLPERNLGDMLVDEGSEITGIDLSYGVEGIQTTYKLQNYSPRKGIFTKDKVNYLQKVGQSLVQTRRNVRELFQARKQRQLQLNARDYGLFERMAYGFKQQSPHSMMVSQYIALSGENRIVTSIQKYKDVPFNLRAGKEEQYKNTAAASLDSLFLGVSNKLDYSGLMPHFRPYDSRLGTKVKSRYELEPIKGSGYNVNWLLTRDSYSGMNRNRVELDYDNARDIALRGSIKLSQWGYDTLGKPYPNFYADGSGVAVSGSGSGINGVSESGFYINGTFYSGLPIPTQFKSDEFSPQYLSHPNLWAAGPVDLKWCQFRSVFTANTKFPAYSITNIPAATSGAWGSGLASIYINGSMTLDRVPVYNHYRTAIPSGRRMFIEEIGTEGIFFAMGPDCTGSLY